jgi:hypothetical protein
MTVVKCNRDKCKYNKNGICSKTELKLLSGNESNSNLETYEYVYCCFQKYQPDFEKYLG